MTKRLVTISFTPLDAGGGVPKFNRDIHSAFPDRECLHFSWWDFPFCEKIEMQVQPEFEKARILNRYLLSTKQLRADDVIVADGFWADGLQSLPFAISHCHGIWGHITKEDVDAGKPPENPLLHSAQVAFRRRWRDLGKNMTAVSDFIAEQMRLQWDISVDRVIDNGVDTHVYRPEQRISDLNDLLIVHGINDPGNLNKGWDHIELLKSRIPSAHVLSLDDAQQLLNRRHEVPWTKPEVLSAADIVVHPSGYEGNSMFVAEALASGTPVVGYDVGFLWKVRNMLGMPVMRRTERSPERTLEEVQMLLDMRDLLPSTLSMIAREVALEHLDIDKFRLGWRLYVQDVEDGVYVP